MNIHIIGICGTFMGGVARLARDLGHVVSGSDANTYPPMSTQLESLGIALFEGFSAKQITADVDIVLVGNSISRGNPELEHVLDAGIPYTSGAQWLGENVLQERWVLAVAGTHGKTTTSSLLAWILDQNDLSPGFLIGGVPENFGQSARIGDTPFFVIEADEYDTAFSDKRSKFVHYRPRTLVLNNLEFDHADIFADLKAIQTQFHHLVKTIPSQGKILFNRDADAINDLLDWGYWSETASFGANDAEWAAHKTADDASSFEIQHQEQHYQVQWNLIGDHNMFNALAAVAAAHHVGIRVEHAVEALSNFKSVKRRMEEIYARGNIRVFDDFAHHPTAIKTTLDGLRGQVGSEHIIAVLEPRSNTMKQGVHKHALNASLAAADRCLIFAGHDVKWNVNELVTNQTTAFDSVDRLLGALLDELQSSTDPVSVVIMSNGGFENLARRLVAKLNTAC